MARIDTLADRIRKKRLQSGLSQQEIADGIGVTQALISTWETGKGKPNDEQIKALGTIIGRINLSRQNTSGNSAKIAVVGAEDSTDEEEVNGPSAFGAWLNRERIQRNMSVPQLSDASGVTPPTIYGIESGKIANPHDKTRKRIAKALKSEIPQDVTDEQREEASISGLGELVDFNPHDDADVPTGGGIYVFYDISNRPIYVGESSNIKRRIGQHRDKFWYRAPIVEGGAYILVEDRETRERIERILIKFMKTNAVLNVQNVDR